MDTTQFYLYICLAHIFFSVCVNILFQMLLHYTEHLKMYIVIDV